MAEETEAASPQDRYEVLKTLLKEQIKANEILKYELMQLNKLYQTVCNEKNILLNELLDHHSACSNAVEDSGLQTGTESSVKDELMPTYKRPLSAVRNYPGEFGSGNDIKNTFKRSRFDANPVKLSPRKDSPTSGGASESNISQEQDPWHQQEDIDDIMSSISYSKTTSVAPPPCSSSNSRNSNSRLQTLANQLNSAAGLNEPSKSSPWQRQLNNSCSPPTLTVSTSVNQGQRSGKATSLVTSSTLTSTGGPISVVQRVGPSTKYLSPANRSTVGLLSTSSLPKANLVINATLASTPASLNAPIQKPALSQGAPAYRLSCSSTGQRILIQPSEHARQIRIQQPDGRVGGLTEDAH